MLPTDRTARKERPLFRGCLQYFPDALAEVAHVSFVGNKQHNGPDAPMHWDRTKSTDQEDCIARHLLDRGKVDDDGLRHSAKVAWRALAMLQIELEKSEPATTETHPGPSLAEYAAAHPLDHAEGQKTVYISGPMRGILDFNFPAFDAARDRLVGKGYKVVSPADMDRLDRLPLPNHEYATRDTTALIDIARSGNGAIYMLKGWENSVGAQAEYHLAKWLELEVLYE